MPVSFRFAALALAVFLAPSTTRADDASDLAAYSSAPISALCGGERAILKTETCKDAAFAKFATEIDQALQAALAKAPANVRPLLKRDHYWFGETINNLVQNMGRPSPGEPDRNGLAGMLGRRAANFAQVADGFGRTGVLGKWVDAFGSIAVTSAERGAYRLAIDTDSGYTEAEDQRWRCQASALVKPAANGWFAGELLVEPNKDGDVDQPRKPLAIKMRRQGETLRVVTALRYGSDDYATGEGCRNPVQITASYFASGKQDAAATDKTETGFVAPTFDCVRPNTESDEEICADPDLALQDVRLNRAWKALLPRLDETTRHALAEDQRNWVREQAGIYPYAIHPGGDKTTYDLHHVGYARLDVDKLQRERIALLEGFDLNRKGLLGLWIGHNAILDVTQADGGNVKANGRKWEWDDYKAGCEYEMQGKVVGGVFRSEEERTNPYTLERDHATLIVNRMDDAFAKKRHGADGDDEMKCRRSMQASSTVRLFPVRYSPDIDKIGDWH